MTFQEQAVAQAKIRLANKPTLADVNAGRVTMEEFCASFYMVPVRTRTKTVRVK